MSYLCAELGLDDLTLVQSMPPDRGVASKQMWGKKRKQIPDYGHVLDEFTWN